MEKSGPELLGLRKAKRSVGLLFYFISILLQKVILLSLVGLAVSFGPPSDNIVDVVPHHSAIGGFGEFVHDGNIKDVVPGLGSVAVVHDVFPPAAHFVDRGQDVNVDVSDVVFDPTSSDVVRDVVPRPGSVDVVSASGVVVRDVVPDIGAVPDANAALPSANAVVHDFIQQLQSSDSSSVVHDVVPASNVVVYDVVKAPRFNTFVHDAIPSSKSIVPEIFGDAHPTSSGVDISDRSGVLPPLFPSDHAQPSNHAAAGPRVNPAVLKCGLKPEPYTLFQFSRLSYSYPKNEIIQEMEHRPDVRAAIFNIDRNGIGLKYHLTPSIYVHGQRSKRQAGSTGECRVQVLTLRQFYAYNNRCWIVNPVYQQVHYHDCGHGCNRQGAGHGTLSRCEATYKSTSVWAYCAGLDYGRRITNINVPLPTGCSCRRYTCS